ALMPTQPAPAPAAAPAPANAATNGNGTATPANGNLTGCPACDINHCTDYPCNDYHCWIIGEYLLWRFDSVPLRPFNAQVAAGNAVVFARQTTVSAGNLPVDVDTTINVPVNVTVSTGLPGGQNPDLRDQPGYRVFVGSWFN